MMILQMDLFCFVLLLGHQIVFFIKNHCAELTVFYFFLWLIWLRDLTEFEIRKKKKPQILPYSWLPTQTYNKNLMIWRKKNSSKSGEFGSFFFIWKNPLYTLKSNFLRSKFCKISSKKKKKTAPVPTMLHTATANDIFFHF